MPRTRLHSALAFAAILLAVAGLDEMLKAAPEGTSPAASQARPDSAPLPVPAAAVIEPEDLARALQSQSQAAADKPLIFQVGFRFLYKQAHIPGSEYLGPASKDEGLQQLRQRLSSVARSRTIVLYCGCCPWVKCPNVKPAYDAVHAMGFTQVKVLRIEENFGANWVAKGFPTAKGE